MDPIAILQSRIEQLEAKLGFTANAAPEEHQGDPASSNLLRVAQAVNNATMGQGKLSEAKPMASELNNYTDPNLVEMVGPMLKSEPVKQIPENQATVDQTLGVAVDVTANAEAVCLGVQEGSEGAAAGASAGEQAACAAQVMTAAEQKLFPRRRNGLD